MTTIEHNGICQGCQQPIEVSSFFTDTNGNRWHWPCAEGTFEALSALTTMQKPAERVPVGDQPPEPFFAHLLVGTGKATLCVALYDDGDVQVGVAFCSPKDQYVKSIGRDKAEGRLAARIAYMKAGQPLMDPRVLEKRRQLQMGFAFKRDEALGRHIMPQVTHAFIEWMRIMKEDGHDFIPRWVFTGVGEVVRPMRRRVRDFTGGEHPARHGAS